MGVHCCWAISAFRFFSPGWLPLLNPLLRKFDGEQEKTVPQSSLKVLGWGVNAILILSKLKQIFLQDGFPKAAYYAEV